MVVSLEYELKTFLASIILAVLSGVLYDLFKSIRTHTKITFLWDILLWVSLLVLTCAVWFFVQNGEIRWYMILGAVLSGIIYRLTLSEYVYFILCFIVDKICLVFSTIFKILLTPPVFLCKIISVYVKKARTGFSKKVVEKYDGKKA